MENLLHGQNPIVFASIVLFKWTFCRMKTLLVPIWRHFQIPMNTYYCSMFTIYYTHFNNCCILELIMFIVTSAAVWFEKRFPGVFVLCGLCLAVAFFLLDRSVAGHGINPLLDFAGGAERILWEALLHRRLVLLVFEIKIQLPGALAELFVDPRGKRYTCQRVGMIIEWDWWDMPGLWQRETIWYRMLGQRPTDMP